MTQLKVGKRAKQVLNAFSDEDGELGGSNCFSAIMLKGVLPKRTRLATMTDFERATDTNPFF
jgi:hypothetical protein